MLATQNIDGLHVREVKNSEILSKVVHEENDKQGYNAHVYEIHGNLEYMHCSDYSEDDDIDQHDRVFHKMPSW